MTSLLIYIVFIWLNLFNNGGHPSHYTVTNIDYTAENKRLAIIIKVNTEDLAFVLAHNYDRSLSFENQTDLKLADTLISNYISTAITFKINKKNKLPVRFQRKEITVTDTWIYGTVSDIKNSNELEIMNALFFDTIMENTNLIIFSKNGVEQGFKTTFYERVITVKLKNRK